MARTATNKTTSPSTSRTSTSRKAKATTSIPLGDDTVTTASDAAPLNGQPAPAVLPGGDGESEGASPAPDLDPAPQPPTSKVGRIRALLASPAGASLPMLCAATGWQSHSVRAALTGLRKAGTIIDKDKGEDGTTIYRVGLGPETQE